MSGVQEIQVIQSVDQARKRRTGIKTNQGESGRIQMNQDKSRQRRTKTNLQ